MYPFNIFFWFFECCDLTVHCLDLNSYDSVMCTYCCFLFDFMFARTVITYCVQCLSKKKPYSAYIVLFYTFEVPTLRGLEILMGCMVSPTEHYIGRENKYEQGVGFLVQ